MTNQTDPHASRFPKATPSATKSEGASGRLLTGLRYPTLAACTSPRLGTSRAATFRSRTKLLARGRSTSCSRPARGRASRLGCEYDPILRPRLLRMQRDHGVPIVRLGWRGSRVPRASERLGADEGH